MVYTYFDFDVMSRKRAMLLLTKYRPTFLKINKHLTCHSMLKYDHKICCRSCSQFDDTEMGTQGDDVHRRESSLHWDYLFHPLPQIYSLL